MSHPQVTNRQRLLNALGGQPNDRPPVWLMRQAGRCLPEYRALKEKYTFRELIADPDLATEVTLQPIRRFDFDAAILFSDILVIPEALGVSFQFTTEGGLHMETLKDTGDIARLKCGGVVDRLQYVAEALKRIKKVLANRTGLLGFAGSPWTLANFMLDGGGMGGRQYTKAFSLYQHDRAAFDTLSEKLTVATIEYLQMQIDCGVDAVQIFDSLGGLLPANDFEAASGRWAAEIVSALRGKAPVIFFSKGTRNWAAQVKTGAQVIGIDHEIDIAEARKALPPTVGMQGNLDPSLLSSADPRRVEQEVTTILNKMRGRPGHIFNLGHGVPPDAKLENMEALVATVRKFA